MKKNYPIIIIASVLLSVAAYLLLSEKKSTIKSELTDFAVTDTASVDKIFLADKSGAESSQVLLERDPSGKGWLVDKNFEARSDMIDILLRTIASIEVRSPVAKAANENVMKGLAANAIKVEIYQKGKLVKTFYVGHASADHMGTFMYLENSSKPFVVHIPGFNGYLTPRFSCEAGNWKTKSVFKVAGPDIENIVVRYYDRPAESFEIRKVQSEFKLFDLEGQELEVAEDRILNYVDHYRNVNFEGYFDQSKTHIIDSVKQVGPFYSITVNEVNGAVTTLNLYRKPIDIESKKQFEEDGSRPPFDGDRMLGILNDDPRMILVQYYVFDKLSIKLNQFLS